MNRTNRRLYRFLYLLITMCLVTSVSARPKIGLALGGGGARGASHVGVLRFLEENNIPVDYIAGTSMGSIVGGLYASGYSIEDLEDLLNTTDWVDILTDLPGYQDLSFRRKQDYSADLFNFELGIRGFKVLIPGGLITGQKVRFKLQKMTMHTAGLTSFDELPIPFRAIATDIETGEVIVLSEGNLAEAIHASFAIPGLISPVEINDRLLVDGGLVSNVPVRAVRDMGADIVIAVNVGAGLKGRDQLNNFAAVTGQIVDLTIYKNVSSEVLDADVLISPDLTGLGSTDFDKTDQIVPRGYEAACRVSELLRPYALKNPERPHLSDETIFNAEHPDLTFMNLHNSSGVSNRWILENIETKVGKPLDILVLKSDLAWLFQTNEFSLIDFRIKQVSEKTGLEIITREKPWGNDTLRFGITIEEDFEGDSFYRLNARYTNTRINSLGAEWRTDIQMGREGLIDTEFYQPLAFKTNYFTSARAMYHRANLNRYENGDNVGEYRVYQYIGIADMGVELGQYGEVRLGGFRGYLDAKLITGQELERRNDYSTGGVRAAVRLDQLNTPSFPTQGAKITAEYWALIELMGSDKNYQFSTFSFQNYDSWGDNTIFSHLALGAKLGLDLPFVLEFTSSGDFALSGYDSNELSGQYIGVARAGYFRHIPLLPAIMGGEFYVGGFVEAGNVLDDIDDFEINDVILTTNIFAGLDTFLGPIFVGYGTADTGKGSFYFKLGHML